MSRPIFINMERMQEVMQGLPPTAFSILMDLLMLYTPEGTGAFHLDAEAFTKAHSARLPPEAKRRYTVAEVDAAQPFMHLFFTKLVDGRYAANPDLFSATDGNLEIDAN